MLKILLPMLMLFSMSSFASLVLDPSYSAQDYLEVDALVINQGAPQRPCVAENEPFERLYNVTGAATQNLELKTTAYNCGYVISLLSLPLEVGWRNLNS